MVINIDCRLDYASLLEVCQASGQAPTEAGAERRPLPGGAEGQNPLEVTEAARGGGAGAAEGALPRQAVLRATRRAARREGP